MTNNAFTNRMKHNEINVFEDLLYVNFSAETIRLQQKQINQALFMAVMNIQTNLRWNPVLSA